MGLALVGDGLAGNLVAERLRGAGVDFVWYGAGNPTLPPVGLLHRHVGRSFDNAPPEEQAWRAASAWAKGLPESVCRSVTMLRPTSHDSRLSSTFDRLELPHVSEVSGQDFPYLAPCKRLFRYDDAFTIAFEALLSQVFDVGPNRGPLKRMERSAGWTLFAADGTRDEVETVVFATGPRTANWFDGIDLKERPGELTLVARPAELPPDVAVSRKGHVGCDPTGRFACVGATYRPRDAAKRPLDVTAEECLDGIARSVPALRDAEPVRHWFGRRAVVHPDRRPVAGETSEDGVWIASGLASKGLLWGARVAEIVVEGVLSGAPVPEETDPRRFGPVTLREPVEHPAHS